MNKNLLLRVQDTVLKIVIRPHLSLYFGKVMYKINAYIWRPFRHKYLWF